MDYSKDCKHRNKYHCTKLDKNIAVDMRNPDSPRCWQQPSYAETFTKFRFTEGCKYYEPKKD